jgi:hypothetical protein
MDLTTKVTKELEGHEKPFLKKEFVVAKRGLQTAR